MFYHSGKSRIADDWEGLAKTFLLWDFVEILVLYHRVRMIFLRKFIVGAWICHSEEGEADYHTLSFWGRWSRRRILNCEFFTLSDNVLSFKILHCVQNDRAEYFHLITALWRSFPSRGSLSGDHRSPLRGGMQIGVVGRGLAPAVIISHCVGTRTVEDACPYQ